MNGDILLWSCIISLYLTILIGVSKYHTSKTSLHMNSIQSSLSQPKREEGWKDSSNGDCSKEGKVSCLFVEYYSVKSVDYYYSYTVIILACKTFWCWLQNLTIPQASGMIHITWDLVLEVWDILFLIESSYP